MEDKETGRLEAFSDGVFAVAITLLVLSIKLPDRALPDGSLRQADGLWRFLSEQWPTLVAYVTSFATIGIMWINHHRLFEHIKRTNTGLMLLNLLLLLVIVFIPHPTALLAQQYTRYGPGEHAAALVYTATNLLMAICFNLVWRYASAHNRLLGRNVDPASVRAISGQYLFGPLLYTIAFGLAWFNAAASIIASFVLALFFAMPARPLRNLPQEAQRTAGSDKELEGEAQ
jgi:uncharacterized membrane protein